MKTVKTIGVVCLLALACGGEAYELDELGTEESELWTEHGFGWKHDPGLGRGIPCDTQAGQICLLPADKNVKVQIDVAQMSATQNNRTKAALFPWLDQLAAQLPGWSFIAHNVNTADIRFTALVGDIHAPLDNNRESYVKVTCTTQGPNLPESTIGAPGTYRVCSRMRAEIDFDNVDDKANLLGVSPALFLSDTVGAAVARAGGHGAESDQLVINSRSVLPVDKFEGLGPRAVCRAGEFDANFATPLSVMSFVCNR